MSQTGDTLALPKDSLCETLEADVSWRYGGGVPVEQVRASSSNGVVSNATVTVLNSDAQVKSVDCTADFRSEGSNSSSKTKQTGSLKTSSSSAGSAAQRRGKSGDGAKSRGRPGSKKRDQKSRPTSTGALTAAYREMEAQTAGACDAGKELKEERSANATAAPLGLGECTEEEFLARSATAALETERSLLMKAQHARQQQRFAYEEQRARTAEPVDPRSSFTFYHHIASTQGWWIMVLFICLIAVTVIQAALMPYVADQLTKEAFLMKMGVESKWQTLRDIWMEDDDCNYRLGEVMKNGKLSLCWRNSGVYEQTVFVATSWGWAGVIYSLPFMASLLWFSLNLLRTERIFNYTFGLGVVVAVLLFANTCYTTWCAIMDAYSYQGKTRMQMTVEQVTDWAAVWASGWFETYWNVAWEVYVRLPFILTWAYRLTFARILIPFSHGLFLTAVIQMRYVRTQLTYLSVRTLNYLDHRVGSSQTREKYLTGREVSATLYVGFGFRWVDWLLNQPGTCSVVFHEQLLQEALSSKFDIPTLGDKDLWTRLNELGRLSALYNNDGRISENDIAGDTIRVAWRILQARRHSRVNKGDPVGF